MQSDTCRRTQCHTWDVWGVPFEGKLQHSDSSPYLTLKIRQGVLQEEHKVTHSIQSCSF